MVMDVIDKDHDRGIDYAEFCSSFRRAAKARALARDVTLEVQSKLRHHQAKLLTIFSSFDTNGDGVLSLDELRSGLRQLGIHLSTEELRRLMEVIDKDGDAQIDYQEFLAIACEDQSPQSDLQTSSRGSPRKSPRQAALERDAHSRRLVHVVTEEMRDVLIRRGGDLDDTFRQMDLNGDGACFGAGVLLVAWCHMLAAVIVVSLCSAQSWCRLRRRPAHTS